MTTAMQRWQFILLWVALGAALSAATGCTRAAFRIRGNREMKALVTEKSNDPRWQLLDFTLEMDNRARYFDPTNVDHPPMPQDDPAAHQYMHLVSGMKGYPKWHKWGDAKFLENPGWRARLGEYVEVNDKGEVVLTLDDSVRLARLHSDAYRNQIETLYLSALDVSTERYGFVTQFWGQTTDAYTHQGTNALGVSAPVPISSQGTPAGAIGLANATSSSTVVNPLTAEAQSTNFVQAQKFFATGAQFTTELINNFAWTVLGHSQSNYNSLASFSLIQPLLKGGGRIIALEQLTITERALLNNLRSMQRYRQGLYTLCAVGDATGVTGPARRGGLLGGTGLTGFSGQGATGLGGVGAATNYGGSLVPAGPAGAGATSGATVGVAGGGAGVVGGFLGLCQQQQQVNNSQDTLDLQVRTEELLTANQQAGLIDLAQVDQFRQNIQSERANLLALQTSLRTALDTFKAGQLDFPMDVELALNDAPIRKFRLIDGLTRKSQFALEDFVKTIGRLPQEPTLEQVKEVLERFERYREPVEASFARARNDLAALQTALPDRERSMDADRLKTFRDEIGKLKDTFLDLQNRFAAAVARLDRLREDLAPDRTDRETDEIVDLASGLASLLGELSLVQARAKLETVSIPVVELEPPRAFRISQANRLDWMNNREELVDTWRLIAYNANSLLSNFSLVFNGNMGTVGNNPVKFSGARGTMQVGVQFDPPFTRRVERNNYLSSLVSYQQARRDFYLNYDQYYQNLRRYLRVLKQLSANLEIQRRAVVIALRRVDQTREVLNRPPDAVAPGQQQAPFPVTSALNLLSALSDLRNAQNNFMSVYLNHHAQRMLLMRELGVFELDDEGLWIDRPLNELDMCEDPGYYMPPPVPTSWFRLAGVQDENVLKVLAGPEPQISEELVSRDEVCAYEQRGERQALAKPWAGPERFQPQRYQPQQQVASARNSRPAPGSRQANKRLIQNPIKFEEEPREAGENYPTRW
jgi:hypothetical protein